MMINTLTFCRRLAFAVARLSLSTGLIAGPWESLFNAGHGPLRFSGDRAKRDRRTGL